MSICFDLTIEDWLAFQDYFRKKKAPVYRLLMPILGITAGLLIILNVLYLLHYEASMVTVLSGILLFFILLLFYYRSKSKKTLYNMAVELKKSHPEVFGEREMVFDEQQISIITPSNTQVIPWSQVEQWEESKQYFYIYNTKGIVYIVPKSCLSDYDEFVGTLNRYFQLT